MKQKIELKLCTCKNCKHWQKYDNTAECGYCCNEKFKFTYMQLAHERTFTPITEPDFFCADGSYKKGLPAADVQEVKHGHWIAEMRGLYHGINLLDDKQFKGLNMYSCSECDEKVIFKGNYCPNCGAKMDGKE